MKYFSKIIVLILISLLLTFCKQKESNRILSFNEAKTVLQTDNCNDPDAAIECCFANMPNQLTSTMIIPDDDSKSEKLIISGTIYKKDKKPYPGVILYAYHTDSNGQYAKKGNETGFQKWHGSHHGWCKTDKNGNYRIETIRPASYPKTTVPQHIHAAIKVPDGNPFYITDFLFKDDPSLPKTLQNKYQLQGGSGIVDVKKTDGVWMGKRDIYLN